MFAPNARQLALLNSVPAAIVPDIDHEAVFRSTAGISAPDFLAKLRTGAIKAYCSSIEILWRRCWSVQANVDRVTALFDNRPGRDDGREWLSLSTFRLGLRFWQRIDVIVPSAPGIELIELLDRNPATGRRHDTAVRFTVAGLSYVSGAPTPSELPESINSPMADRGDQDDPRQKVSSAAIEETAQRFAKSTAPLPGIRQLGISAEKAANADASSTTHYRVGRKVAARIAEIKAEA